MSNRLNSEKEEEVKGLLKNRSIREIAKETGVAKNTIARIRNENLTEEEKTEFKKLANVKGRNKRELERAKAITPGFKVCTKCEKEKSIDEFTVNSRTKDGLQNHCRECKTAGQRARRSNYKIINLPQGIKSEGRVEQTGQVDQLGQDKQMKQIEQVETKNGEISKLINSTVPVTFGDVAKKYLEALEKRYDELEKHIKEECADLIRISYRIAGLIECVDFLNSANELDVEEGWKDYLNRTMDELYEEQAKKKNEPQTQN